MTNAKVNLKSSKIVIPAHITLAKFGSREYEQKVRLQKDAYEKARGMVMALWSNESPNRQNTFIGKGAAEVRDAFMAVCTMPEMMDVEQRFYEKFGSYAAVSYEEWANKVHNLFPKTNTFNPNSEALTKSIAKVRSGLIEGLNNIGYESLVPLSISNAMHATTKGKNSGFPYFSKKWSKTDAEGKLLQSAAHAKEKSPEEMWEYYTTMSQSLINGIDVLQGTPYILFKRVAPNGLDTPKMRAVECPAKTEAIAAKAFTDVLTDAMQTIPEYYGLNGVDRVHEVIGEFFKREFTVEGDFSSFDNSCGPMMKYVFDLLRDITDHEYDAYFNIVEAFYKHPTIITPMGLMSSNCPAGLMSGSGWTSIIGTLVNSIAVHYTMEMMGVDDYANLAFGDDIALNCNYFDEEEFERHMRDLNLLCNKEKQAVSTGLNARVSFLGSFFFKAKPELKGVFPIMRCAPGLYYSEKFSDVSEACGELNVDEEEFKGISKLGVNMLGLVKKMDNCRNHADFEKFVKLVVDNEPSNLDTSMIMPFEKLEIAFRAGRTSRGSKLAESDIMQLLFTWQNEDFVKQVYNTTFKLSSKQTENMYYVSINKVTIANGNTTVEMIKEVPFNLAKTSKETFEIEMVKLKEYTLGLNLGTVKPAQVKRTSTTKVFEQSSVVFSEIVTHLNKGKVKIDITISSVGGNLIKVSNIVGSDLADAAKLSLEFQKAYIQKVTNSSQLQELFV